MLKIEGGITMYLILYTLLIILLTIHTIADYKKVKSNKEVIELNNKVYIAQKELSNKVDKQLELEKKRLELTRGVNEEIKIISDNWEVMKLNLTLDNEMIAKEVIKIINKKTKRRKNDFKYLKS